VIAPRLARSRNARVEIPRNFAAWSKLSLPITPIERELFFAGVLGRLLYARVVSRASSRMAKADFFTKCLLVVLPVVTKDYPPKIDVNDDEDGRIVQARAIADFSAQIASAASTMTFE
jgi:hypothetical protein